MKNILMLLSVTLAFTLFAGCSDDKIPTVSFSKNVVLDKDAIELEPMGAGEVMITDGNGSYSVSSTDETVATAEVEGNKVKITGHVGGQASIIVVDKEGVGSIVSVKVVNDITLSESHVDVNLSDAAAGLSYSKSIDIIGGNGGCTVTCDNENIILRIEDNTIIIVGKAEVKDQLAKVVDSKGKTFSFTITVVDAFKAFKADATVRGEFMNDTMTESELGKPFYRRTQGALYSCGYSVNARMCLEVQFIGGLELGKKTNAKVQYGVSSGDFASFTLLNSLNIIQKKDKKIWIMFDLKGSIGFMVVQP